MSIQVKLRRGTTAQHSTFTGSEGEVTVDTTKDVVVVHDGTTAGGHPMVKASSLAAVATSGDYNDLINKPSGGSGTVTSVGLTAPTGFAVTGSPVTTSGTLALGFDTGYSLPTTVKQSQWDTAYGWGNHASAGYLSSGDIGVTVQGYNANTVIDASYVHTDNNYTTAEKSKLAGIEAGAEVNVNADWNAVSGDAQILNKPTIPSKTSDLTNDSGFITGYTETDPVFLASPAGGITGTQVINWDTAYGWGNHASAGYLDSGDIGTSVQAYDADLTAWAGVSTSAKQDTLVSGTNIKTVNSSSLLGSGDLALFGGGLTKIEKVSSLPGSPDANTLYIVV